MLTKSGNMFINMHICIQNEYMQTRNCFYTIRVCIYSYWCTFISFGEMFLLFRYLFVFQGIHILVILYEFYMSEHSTFLVNIYHSPFLVRIYYQYADTEKHIFYWYAKYQMPFFLSFIRTFSLQVR